MCGEAATLAEFIKKVLFEPGTSGVGAKIFRRRFYYCWKTRVTEIQEKVYK